MKQVHKFDEDVSRNVLITANANTVVLVHGYKFDPEAQVSEVVLQRTRRNHIKIDKIQPSCRHEEEGQRYSGSLVGAISCSIFLNQNNGTILCFSFRSVGRSGEVELVRLILEKLELNRDTKFEWVGVAARDYEIGVAAIGEHGQPKRKEPVRLFEIVEHRKERANPLKSMYQVIGFWG